MRFEEKLAVALGLLASTGMWRSSYAPPLYRLLWMLGGKTPPPHFQSFTANFGRAGVWFAIMWGLLMRFAWSHALSFERIFIGSTLTGVLFGLAMAAHYRYDARKYGIPLWRDFHPADDTRI